jgi:hypothetical protein
MNLVTYGWTIGLEKLRSDAHFCGGDNRTDTVVRCGDVLCYMGIPCSVSSDGRLLTAKTKA